MFLKKLIKKRKKKKGKMKKKRKKKESRNLIDETSFLIKSLSVEGKNVRRMVSIVTYMRDISQMKSFDLVICVKLPLPEFIWSEIWFIWF